jgi:chaperonin GroEL
MTFNKGWTSQYFVNNHENQTVEFDRPKILLCNSKISNFTTLANIIQDTLQAEQPLVIFAESFDTSVTQALALNIMRSGGRFKIACVEAPGYGERRLDILRDIACYVGGNVADDPLGIKYETMSSADFGSCEKIIIKKDETIIRGGFGEQDQISERIKAINGLIGALKENDTYEREQLGKRLASLTTGVAVIQVGGSSEEEIKELRDRLDDSTWAVKAALEEGYLPGAGNTLLYLSEKVESEVKTTNSNEALGVKVFANALKAPFKTIVDNAGLPVELVTQEVLSKNDYNIGYDAKNLKVCNLIEAGILDPTKVVKGTVYAASSIAAVTLTSNVMITVDPIENKGLSLNMMADPMM